MRTELLNRIRNEINSIVTDELEYDDIALEVFKSHIDEIRSIDTNKLYVYIGTYKDDYNGNIVEVDRNDYDASFSLYKDIESKSEISVEIHECDYFEKSNRVLYGNVDKIRKEFIVNALEKGQEYSSEDLINRRRI